MTKDTPTPRTDALTFDIEARRKLRGFNMPEDLADALNLSDEIERDLTACREVLRELYDADLEMAKLSFRTWNGTQWLWNDAVWEHHDPEGFARMSAARAILQSDEGEKS